jgi:hypothetical protein
MEFIGNNKLTQILREKVANYHPMAFGPCLNNVAAEAAHNVLNRYIGDFAYVHAQTTSTYSTFLVRSGEGFYTFIVNRNLLPEIWNDNVPDGF